MIRRWLRAVWREWKYYRFDVYLSGEALDQVRRSDGWRSDGRR